MLVVPCHIRSIARLHASTPKKIKAVAMSSCSIIKFVDAVVVLIGVVVRSIACVRVGSLLYAW